jgi:hypothetical protein
LIRKLGLHRPEEPDYGVVDKVDWVATIRQGVILATKSNFKCWERDRARKLGKGFVEECNSRQTDRQTERQRDRPDALGQTCSHHRIFPSSNLARLVSKTPTGNRPGIAKHVPAHTYRT